MVTQFFSGGGLESLMAAMMDNWDEQVTRFTQAPIKSVGIAPDGNNAVLIHDADPSINAAAPWPYTLVDLQTAFPLLKLQSTVARPGSVLFTPDGQRAVVTIRSDAAEVRQVDLVNLASFIVETLPLGSPPEGASFVDATKKILVSQEHPTGRISFIDENGQVQTVTGFELNDTVKD